MRRKRESTHPAAGQPRGNRRIHAEGGGKLPELAACPACGASYRNGRWTWQQAPVGSYERTCPACERIAANDPAGELRLTGRFLEEHRAELEGCLRNVEKRERDEHPLRRILAIRSDGDELVVGVTEAKLVIQLGHAVASAYDGKLELPATTADRDAFLRARWRRD